MQTSGYLYRWCLLDEKRHLFIKTYGSCIDSYSIMKEYTLLISLLGDKIN